MNEVHYDEAMEEIGKLAIITQKEFVMVHGEIADLHKKMTDEFVAVRREMTDEFTTVHGEIADLHEEMTGEFAKVREEMSDGLAKVHEEMKAGFRETNAEIRLLRGEIKGILVNHEVRVARLEERRG